MAALKRYYASPIGTDSMFELNESNVWNVSSSPELRKSVSNSRISKKSSSTVVKQGEIGGTASSLPVSLELS
ncbi:hypothetical protein L6452_34842 [Arctium lappa]|uniref:Uncharacterized protein n=1 Tax=Arctium lappa TaxID=4217 RepID=A0ACB8YKE2_ARCLA|nr:hypothetical protein L6452_34842 [Arctium lappa]